MISVDLEMEDRRLIIAVAAGEACEEISRLFCLLGGSRCMWVVLDWLDHRGTFGV